MRSLALIGPLTVPQIVQMRPTSRQRMHRLADERAAEGLVELIDNPRHRRSKLVRLTRKGAAPYRDLIARFLTIASTMGADLLSIGQTTGVPLAGDPRFGYFVGGYLSLMSSYGALNR